MKIHDWRIEVRDFNGVNLKGYILPSTPGGMTRDGITMSLDPHGSCLEASWQGKAIELSPFVWVQKRDLVQVQVKETSLSAWTPIWAGVLIEVPNRYSSRSQGYKAFGLKWRLKQSFTSADHAEATASEVLEDYLTVKTASVGFTVDSADFTGGLTMPAVAPVHQTYYELLDQIASAGGLVWGINSLREAFGRPPESALMMVTEGPGTTITWNAVSAIDFVSGVEFVWKDTTAGYGSFTVVDSALESTYGQARTLVWLEDDAPAAASSTAVFEDSLTELAQTVYFAPQADVPATISTPGFLAPTPTVEVTRVDSSTVEIPVTEVEYVISKSRNGVTNIKAGSRLTPDQAAQQFLIKQRDQQAKGDAIRISKGAS